MIKIILSLSICSIIYFSSFLVLLKNSSRNFKEDILCLVFEFVAFVGFVATSGSVAGSRVGILSQFFIRNNLLLKLLRTFSLALNNNPKLFKKYFLSSAFVPLSKFFNPLAKLICLLSAPSIDKCPLQ